MMPGFLKFRRVIPYQTVYIIVSCILILLGCSREKGSISQKHPNILIAIADDISFPHMGAYGTDWTRTPGFDFVAENGLLFHNAYTPNAKCAPSRACILTGRNSWQLDEAANHVPFFPEKYITFMEALSEKGYHTGHTAKGWAPGIAEKDGIPRQLTGQAYNNVICTPPTSHISKNDYAANFEAFLNSNSDDRPFVFWYGSLEPHRAYEYGSGASSRIENSIDIKEEFPFWPDTDSVRSDVEDYAFEIEYFDTHLHKMIQSLDQRNILDNTLIIVTADNGMPFPRVKGQAYEMSNHMPLAMMWKDGISSPGRDIDEMVSFIDFAPTILDVLQVNIETTRMQPIQGRSLTSYFRDDDIAGSDPGAEFILIGKERHDIGRPGDRGYPIRGIVKDSFIYLYNFYPARWPAGNPVTGYLNTDGSPTKTEILHLYRNGRNTAFWDTNFGKRPSEELFNRYTDPFCMNNLASIPEFRPVKESMKRIMFHALDVQKDPRISSETEIFDHFPYANDAHRNFYERFMNGELTTESAGWVNPDDFELSDP
jgi:arylsulfatase A-like enzyme